MDRKNRNNRANARSPICTDSRWTDGFIFGRHSDVRFHDPHVENASSLFGNADWLAAHPTSAREIRQKTRIELLDNPCQINVTCLE